MRDGYGVVRSWVLVGLAAGAALSACARSSVPSDPEPATRAGARAAEPGASASAPSPAPASPPDQAPAANRAAPPARVRAPDMAPAWVPVPEPAESPKPALPPVPPPEIRFTDLNGLRAEIAAFRENGRPVLVNFWATWCGPCVHELPLLGDLAREWGDGGPAVLGVSLDHLTAPDDSRAMERVQPMLARHRVSYPNRIVRGDQDEVLAAFGIVGGIPFSILYDQRGMVARRFSGAVDGGEIRKAVGRINQTVGS